MHVVRPSIVLILVLPRRSSKSSDSARILTYPPFGIYLSKNQFMPISACTSHSSRSRGSSTASGLKGTSHYIRRFTRAGPLKKSPPKWQKCESFRGNGLRSRRQERVMDRMDGPRTSIDEWMLSGRRAVMIV